MANQSTNPDLTDIDIFYVGVGNDDNFSDSAKAAVASLKSKGLTIALTEDQHYEMKNKIEAIEYAD